MRLERRDNLLYSNQMVSALGGGVYGHSSVYNQTKPKTTRKELIGKNLVLAKCTNKKETKKDMEGNIRLLYLLTFIPPSLESS
jgi:hypothetical protein